MYVYLRVLDNLKKDTGCNQRRYTTGYRPIDRSAGNKKIGIVTSNEHPTAIETDGTLK